MVTKADLPSIIKSFGTAGIVFSNEQDFQLVLGSRIRSWPDVKNIFFEALSLPISFSVIQSNVKKLGKNTSCLETKNNTIIC